MVAQVGRVLPPERAGSRRHDHVDRKLLSAAYLSWPGLSLSCFSSSILMRSDFRNLRSWSLILNSGLVDRVVTSEVLSDDFSPCLLTPMVASRTRKMSYPPSL